MARFRRGLQSVVRSNKEIIDGVFLKVTGAVITDVLLATAVNDYDGTVGTCPIGSKIKGCFIEWTYNADSTLEGRMDWYFAKIPAGLAIASFPIPGATGGNLKRKYIFQERKGLTNPFNTSATFAVSSQIRGGMMFLKIPRRFQNMAEGDFLAIRVQSSVDYNFCLKVIYKWFA